MKNYDSIPAREFIFAGLFVVSNRLDTLMERALKPFQITSKQWFLSLIVGNAFDEPPTVKQVAEQMGCSHQNAKQVALKLKEKGLIKMEKDANDRRVTRMSLTEKNLELWQDLEPTGDEFMKAVFEGISQEEMESMRSSMSKIIANIEKMDTK